MASMLDEMTRTLARRRAAVEKTQTDVVQVSIFTCLVVNFYVSTTGLLQISTRVEKSVVFK